MRPEPRSPERPDLTPGRRVPEFDYVVAYPRRRGYLPSGLQATEPTVEMCPCRVQMIRPSSASQTLTKPSMPAEASSLPSRLQATERTSPECAGNPRSSPHASGPRFAPFHPGWPWRCASRPASRRRRPTSDRPSPEVPGGCGQTTRQRSEWPLLAGSEDPCLGGDSTAVGAPGRPDDAVQFQRSPLSSCIPDLRGAIHARRRDSPAVGAPGHGLDGGGMPPQDSHEPFLSHVPDLHRPVLTGHGQETARLIPFDLIHITRRQGKSMQLIPRACIPDLDRVVAA